jgi:anaerobic selenocysteine-containing dehydrogenase
MASVGGGEDVWIPSVCGMCPDQCGILVHRVNGVVIKIEGNPGSPLGRGRLCARGLAGIQLLYDPHRLNQPLKRGNPEKGIGTDPCWQPVSWDEALEIIVEKLKQVRAEDPSRLLLCGTAASPAPLAFALGVFLPAFGSPNAFVCDQREGGSAVHPDADFCEYLLLFGADCISGAMAEKMADARVRGMRVVAAEPFLSPAAEKADEWLPIRPGSEGALACAILNLLLNEYGLFDAEYIRRHTDGPYLLRPDGAYAREGADGKPLVWDVAAGRVRPFDEEGADAAIEGTYAVDGEECRPVFQFLREAVQRWTPDAAAEATTIPAETIRRIAREFGEAARIGKTLAIEGRELPLRPAAAVGGASVWGHDNARPAALAITLLNQVVGASDVPGGLLGGSPVSLGYPQTGLPRWEPTADRDGLLQSDQRGSPPTAWPLASSGCRPEVLIDYGSNLLMGVAGPERCCEALKDCFVISVGLYSDEAAEALADIVLPDASYLERLDPVPNLSRHRSTAGLGEWACQLRQPAVPPLSQRRHFSEVLLEIGERLGIADAMNATANALYGLRPPHALDPEGRYSWEEMADRIYQGWFGPEHGLTWFRENGVLTWPKRLEEAYWKPFGEARVSLRHEWLARLGEEVQRWAQIGFDLQAVSYEVPWHAASQTHENPWLDEVSQGEPYGCFICLNPRTAAARGIADGNPIWVESTAGYRVRGRACLTEGVHPEAAAIAGGGHWARGMPVACGQGVFFNALLAFDLDAIDPAFVTTDGGARGRVYKE